MPLNKETKPTHDDCVKLYLSQEFWKKKKKNTRKKRKTKSKRKHSDIEIDFYRKE